MYIFILKIILFFCILSHHHYSPLLLPYYFPPSHHYVCTTHTNPPHPSTFTPAMQHTLANHDTVNLFKFVYICDFVSLALKKPRMPRRNISSLYIIHIYRNNSRQFFCVVLWCSCLRIFFTRSSLQASFVQGRSDAQPAIVAFSR